MIHRDLYQARLQKLVRYCPETGAFTSLVSFLGGGIGGEVSGKIDSNGYRQLSLIAVPRCPAHLVAWIYVHGTPPRFEIDHINGDKLDNRIANLRDVPHAHNMQNRRRAHRNNGTGLLGVRKVGARYIAQITVTGRTRYLGKFDSAQEAHERYLQEKRKHHPGCTL